MMLTSRGDFIDKSDWSRPASRSLPAVSSSCEVSQICSWFVVAVPLGFAGTLVLLDGLHTGAMQLARLIHFGSSFAAPMNLVLPP